VIDMIRSDKQYQAAKKQLVSLRKALAAGSHAKAPEAVIRAARGQTAELAAQIEKEVKDYEQLQKTQARELRIFSRPARGVSKTRSRGSSKDLRRFSPRRSTKPEDCGTCKSP
jgi:hypothetical protein